MKRAICTIFILLALITVAQATTYYVDATCPSAGTGISLTCGASGPKILLADGLSLLSTPGDILNVRGIHSAHGTCPGDTNGRYGADRWSISLTGTSASPYTIQNYGYTGTLGSGETVYLEGTAAPGTGVNLGWTQCADCTAGSATVACRNVPSTCGDVWWTTKNAAGNPGNMNSVIGAQRPNGSPTRREVPSTCSGADLDTQYDSCSAQTDGATLAVRWASATPNSTNKPYVFFDNNGQGFRFINASYVTVQGFTMRDWRTSAFTLESGNSNIRIINNTIIYVADKYGNGSDRPVYGDESNNITVQGNDISCSGSEAIHVQAMAGDVATVWTITDNYIHDVYYTCTTDMGPGTDGTPSAMILTLSTDSSSSNGAGNYTGTIVEGNLMSHIHRNPSYGRSKGFIFENNCSGIIFRNNIINDVDSTCVYLEANGTGIPTAAKVSNNQIYNNLLYDCATVSGGDYAIRMETGGLTTNNNLFYNNTVVGRASFAGALTHTGSGTATGNEFRNNIFADTSGSQQMVDWGVSGEFDNNLIKSAAAGTLVAFNGSNYTCATVSTLQTSNQCATPNFANTTTPDFHIQTTSPAKDAGTSTGLPSGKTKDINNTVADDHGLPSYADNQAQAGSAWDIGADEFSTGGTVTLTISKTDSPDPVVAGNNITYTLAYQNTGTTSATGVTIVDPVPANTTFVSATGGGALGGGNVTWSIGTVAAGASSSVQMVVAVTSPLADGTVITNSAYSITSNETASVIGVADTTTVTSLPVLLVSMSDAPDPVLAGSNITYTIFYSNTGTAGATNVVISDAVPIGTTFVSATNSGTNSGGVVTWNIGAVNAGSFSSVQMVVTSSSGLSNGATITNSTYSLASSELSTINGTPIQTSVIALVTSIPQPKFPITSRQNGWAQTQTLLFDGADDVIQTPNSGQWIRGQASENLTLSTSGSTTDTSANLLPANAIIEAVVARVTTTITVATDWKLGDAAQGARFSSADSTMTAGETKVGLNHMNPTVATADLGPVQTSAAKVRVTTTGTPGAGAIRITVFYRQFVPPTN